MKQFYEIMLPDGEYSSPKLGPESNTPVYQVPYPSSEKSSTSSFDFVNFDIEFNKRSDEANRFIHTLRELLPPPLKLRDLL